MAETAWVTCECGKEHALRGTSARLYFGIEEYRQLSRRFMCKACSADLHIEEDMCPEYVPDGRGGGSMCKFGWHHAGRCEPKITREMVQEALRGAH